MIFRTVNAVASPLKSYALTLTKFLLSLIAPIGRSRLDMSQQYKLNTNESLIQPAGLRGTTLLSGIQAYPMPVDY